MDINLLNQRDASRVLAINRHINDIYEVLKLTKDYNAFVDNNIYRNAIINSILQIGENANNLSNEFRDLYNSIPWRKIIGTRNVVVHHYDAISYIEIWKTCQEDIPLLENLINKIIVENKLKNEYKTVEI